MTVISSVEEGPFARHLISDKQVMSDHYGRLFPRHLTLLLIYVGLFLILFQIKENCEEEVFSCSVL